jgi:HSP20 family protein
MEELRSFLSEIEGGHRGRNGHEPPLDVYETASEIVIEIELPGMEREDIGLRLFRNVLVLEGVKRKESLPGVAFHRLERHFGRFVRILEVPPSADPEQVRAQLEQGILVIRFARVGDRQASSRTIPID